MQTPAAIDGRGADPTNLSSCGGDPCSSLVDEGIRLGQTLRDTEQGQIGPWLGIATLLN